MRVKFSSFREVLSKTFVLEAVSFSQFSGKPRGKRSFWKSRGVLGSLRSQFFGKSRGKRSFWKSSVSVCGKSLVENARFESPSQFLGESLVENARFGSGKNLVENARFGSLPSQFLGKNLKTRVLEVFRLNFGEKTRGKRSFWKSSVSQFLGKNLVQDARFGSLSFWESHPALPNSLK